MLANRTTRLTEEFFISGFISGLKEDLKHNVWVFCPTYMFVVIGLARLQEEKQIVQHHVLEPPYTRLRIFIATVPKKTLFPIKHLMPAKAKARRDKGLCYNFDKKIQSWSSV